MVGACLTERGMELFRPQAELHVIDVAEQGML